ncbi:MAG TPA: indolepyruvate ferredoxin oxidoreductase subunit alpha [Dehalococcoidia bacterium]|nr:indolepyruvate ferredoxin oxidoreductase subunit alpha [Dehalococcoidia bacterium]
MKELTISSDAPGERLFVLGNEAIARGAIEAGVQVAAAYPGTPSSEILETLAGVAKGLDMYAEWSTNEKVAFEVALAASICGIRSMASMKHVGVNVAHDPLMTAGYMGAKGGLVLVSADDPWAWSSQNEQDNRYIALQGYIPVLEPSSVQEAKDMMADAFELSEEFKHLFMFRSVTRIGHARGDIVLGKIARERRKGQFVKDRTWLVYTPREARINKPLMLERFDKIKKRVNTLPYNQLKLADGARLGVVACGLSYSYTLEALKWLGIEDRVSLLKIGTPHPLPEELVIKLLSSVKEVLIAEELDPFVELHVKAIAGENNIPVKIHGKDRLPRIGELSTRKVTEAIADLTKSKPPLDFGRLDKLEKETAPLLPWRPPALCPGCSHRASHYAIRVASKRVARDYGQDIEPIYPGDIGCYNLAYNPPQEAVDTTICMGGSFGIANGLAHVIEAPIVAHLGDSTFFHAGIPPLINAVYNKANVTMVIMDNSATAMTGFQPHPGTGYTAMGEKAVQLKPEDIAKACGVEFVEVVDPFDLKKATETMEKAIRFPGPAVVVSRRLCAMIEQREKRKRKEAIIPYRVDQDKCNEKCNACIELLGCPALIKEDGRTVIDSALCTGCGLCAQVCPYKAIVEEKP